MLNHVNRRNVIAFVMLLGTMFLMGNGEVLARKGNRATETRVEGTLTAVNLGASSVNIRRLNGTVVTVVVSATTKIERNDVEVALNALRVGDRAQARILIATGVTRKLESTGP
jgi:hypothetical protein